MQGRNEYRHSTLLIDYSRLASSSNWLAAVQRFRQKLEWDIAQRVTSLLTLLQRVGFPGVPARLPFFQTDAFDPLLAIKEVVVSRERTPPSPAYEHKASSVPPPTEYK